MKFRDMNDKSTFQIVDGPSKEDLVLVLFYRDKLKEKALEITITEDGKAGREKIRVRVTLVQRVSDASFNIEALLFGCDKGAFAVINYQTTKRKGSITFKDPEKSK